MNPSLQRLVTFFLFAAICFLSIPVRAQPSGIDLTPYQQIRFVSRSTGSDTLGDGSEALPWMTLSHALDQITDATQTQVYAVLISSGTYTGQAEYSSFEMKEWVHLFGGFNPANWARDVKMYPTVLSGEDVSRVLWIESNCVIDGVVITKGYTRFGGGGVICSIIQSATISNCIIVENMAGDGGGIICHYSEAVFINCVISSNRAETDNGRGGGIFCEYDYMTHFINCTIIGNSSYMGGAIYTYNSAPQFTNCTILDNRSIDQTGGIKEVYQSSPVLANCILWNWGSEISLGWSSIIAASNCCIRGGWTGSDNIDAYPLFVDPGSGDYHLKNGSACIDSASSTIAPPYDHDHNPRPGGDGKVDIGAYESPESYEPAVTVPLQRIYVSAAASPGGNGASWEQSLPSIQDALRFASAGAEIWVASGVYPEAIWCRENVSLYGGFTGNETTLLERNPEIAKTIIDATGSGYCAVVMADGTTIDGFTIQGGCGVDAGGLSIVDITSATIENCNIRRNQSISSNYPTGGGGVSCRNSTINIYDSVLDHNYGYYGGGIHIYSSSIKMNGCIISENKTNDPGAGIRCTGGKAVIGNSLIIGNQATSWNSEGSGGGLYIDLNSDVSLINSTISGFIDTGILCSDSSLQISNCIIWNHGTDISVSFPKIMKVSNSCVQGGWEGEGNINCYPCFVDPSNGDYHLLDGSCCIDAASIETAPFFDLDGNYRPGGDGLVDMGAYESPDSFTADTSSPPSRFYVSSYGPVDGNGTSWENAFTSLNEAMWNAADGPEIWVASGEYHESVFLEDDVKVYGGFTGNESALDERNWMTNHTKIDATGTKYRAVTGAEEAIMSGFTIMGGSTSRGGGLLISNINSATFEHCVITQNTAADPLHSGYGGGLYINNSRSTFYDCKITNNFAKGELSQGAGCYCNQGESKFINCTISNNKTEGYPGGGIQLEYFSATLINCIINNNYASEGSALWVVGSKATLHNCTIVKNSSQNGYAINCGFDSIVAFKSSILWNHGGEIRDFGSANITSLYSFIQGGWEGENYEQYPMFVDPENGDYHLLNGSPCIDWGSENTPSETDRDGNPRVQGFAADAGAYESPANYEPYFSDPQHRFFVSASVPEGGKGISWSDPLRSIKDALWFSTGNAEIWVASGVYHESITLEESTRLWGGFRGHETNVDERDWISYPTVIDATGTGNRAITGVNDVVIDGFEVRGGEADYGGGIRLSLMKSATVSNCRITLNTARMSGGGVHATGSSYNLTNCFITRNRCIGSEVSGAGMVLLDKGSVYNCVVSDNQMIGGFGSNFVGVYCQKVSLINCTMTGNRMLTPHSYSISTLGHWDYSATLINCLLWNDLDQEISGHQGYLSPINCNIKTLTPNTNNSNISVDPHLAEDGYHLLEGSPCIGAGKGPQEDSRIPLFDIDGDPRSGATCDIGADEYYATTWIKDWSIY